jgi:metallophosphoesterase superfamily enzyme
MDGIIEKLILLTIAVAILFYSMAYVILPAFNVTYSGTVTGLSTSILQGLFFLMFLIVMFAFILMIIYSALKKKGR